jgi:chromosome segregation ATPase
MKIVKNIGAAGLVILAGLGGYFLISWDAMGEKVAEHGVRIGKVEGEAQKNQGRIETNAKDIEILKGDVAEARKELVEAEGRIKDSQARLDAAEGELKKALESSTRNEGKVGELSKLIEKITREQANLKGELGRRALKVQDLGDRLKQQERINIDFDRRLRMLEDKAGLKPPIP